MSVSRSRGLSQVDRRPWWALLSLAIIAATVGNAHAQQPKGEFPPGYFMSDPQVRAIHRSLEGKPAPLLSVKEWHGKPFNLAELKGKIVVVDFWGTWCGPCVAAIPHNVKLVQDHAKDGVVIIGMHDANRGWNNVASVVKSKKINYPIALDDGGKSAKAWMVRFWPTYGVIDRNGTLRALGLSPPGVEAVVKKLLAEPAPADEKDAAKQDEKAKDTANAAGAIPEAWLEGNAKSRRRLEELLASESAPSLQVQDWISSTPIDLAALTGKVVLIDFCTPTRDASTNVMVRINKLYQEHKDDGLVVIGVCDSNAAKRMPEVAEKLKLEYPLAIDRDGQTAEAFEVDNLPDLYMVDRAGKVRIADLRDSALDEAIAMLLAEQPVTTTSSAR